MFHATVLIDNIADKNLINEWGFCVLIDYRGKSYLLDTGGSDRYLKNADRLQLPIESVDAAILSHAHCDHSGGFRSFFERNTKAKLYVSAGCQENCYFRFGPVRKYVGVPKGILGQYRDRIIYAGGLYSLGEGVWLIPHLKNGLEKIGEKAHMYRKDGGRIMPDDFCHEQSLVFETEKGLVVLNSCSHGGLPNIVRDVSYFLPEKKVYMTIGGLHLAGMRKREVREVAATIQKLGIEHVVTGHCTGKKAFRILREELGTLVQQTFVGMTIEI